VKTKTEKMSGWTKNIYPELMQIKHSNEHPNLAFVPVLLYWAGGMLNHFEQSIQLQERIRENLKKVGIEL
jgi:hypothetical protein